MCGEKERRRETWIRAKLLSVKKKRPKRSPILIPPSPHTQVMHCVSDAEGCSLLCWCSTYLDRHGLLFVSTLFPPRVTKKRNPRQTWRRSTFIEDDVTRCSMHDAMMPYDGLERWLKPLCIDGWRGVDSGRRAGGGGKEEGGEKDGDAGEEEVELEDAVKGRVDGEGEGR